MTKLSVLLVTVVPILLTGCDSTDTDPSSQQGYQEHVQLSVQRAVGSEIGDSTEVFGGIAGACRDPEGNVLVLDQVSRGIKVFSHEGEYLEQVGRGGDGPGEFALPMDIACLSSGVIIVHDPMNNAYISFDAEHEFAGNISLWDNGPPIETCAVGDSSFAGLLLEFDMEREQPMITRKLGIFSDSREPDVLIHADEVPFDFSNFTSVLSSMLFAFVVSGDDRGRFFYSPVSSEIYEVFCFSGNGEQFLHITRDLPRVAKTELEMEEEIRYIESWASRMGMQGVAIEWEPDPYRNFIRAIGVDNNDRLWVARASEDQPVFDVYDMDGEELFTAVLQLDGNSWQFSIDQWGILAWDEDPVEGYQQLYIIPYPE